jgi:imidazolonepropionase-like amidohydrolase
LLCPAFLLTACGGKQPSEYAISHVTVITPGTGEAQANATVIVRGESIASVVPSNQFKPSASAKVIDGSGKYIIPGLWDMHMHFRSPDRDLKMDIANGVLGIRNMGGVAKDVFPLRDAIEERRRLGPKIVACGPIIDGPNSWSNPAFTVSVKTVEEARNAVVSLKQQGTDCIKVYDGLSRDSYYAIVEQAKNLNVPVVGHLPSAISVREASAAGQRTLEHGIALAGGSTAEAQYIRQRLDQSAFQEAMRTKNFELIPIKIAKDETLMLDHFNQKLADEMYSLLAKNGTFITPTLVTQRALTFANELGRENDPRTQYVSDNELNSWKPQNGMLTKYRTPEYIAMRKREYAKMLEEVHRAQSLGVRLLAGTDITIPYTYPGFSLQDELALFIQAGLTPMQALETATTNPALMLGLSQKWGRVAADYSANFLLLDANPLADIANTKKIDAVVVNGKFLDRAALDRMLEEARVPKAVGKNTVN